MTSAVNSVFKRGKFHPTVVNAGTKRRRDDDDNDDDADDKHSPEQFFVNNVRNDTRNEISDSSDDSYRHLPDREDRMEGKRLHREQDQERQQKLLSFTGFGAPPEIKLPPRLRNDSDIAKKLRDFLNGETTETFLDAYKKLLIPGTFGRFGDDNQRIYIDLVVTSGCEITPRARQNAVQGVCIICRNQRALDAKLQHGSYPAYTYIGGDCAEKLLYFRKVFATQQLLFAEAVPKSAVYRNSHRNINALVTRFMKLINEHNEERETIVQKLDYKYNVSRRY